ncbi:hypothetical protein A8139_17990 [Marinomonas primoryensis]|uniref:Uncharacterized protein n=1 Tax=Marinomonas primoryensis TaxID=178399 RepID=A0A2Z4PVX4_9GAMM|nr:hypothetical protein A8139_17990 [Marinomonas primoryensis]
MPTTTITPCFSVVTLITLDGKRPKTTQLEAYQTLIRDLESGSICNPLPKAKAKAKAKATTTKKQIKCNLYRLEGLEGFEGFEGVILALFKA